MLKQFIERYKKIIGVLSGLLILLGIIDYLIKWKILSFIFNNFLKPGFYFIIEHHIGTFIIVSLLWLLCLTVYLRKILLKVKNKETSQTNLELAQRKLKQIDLLTKNLSDNRDELNKISSKLKSLESEYFKHEKFILEFRMREYKKNNQIGELSCAVDLLELAIKDNNEYDIEDALALVLKYIREQGIDRRLSTTISKLRELLGKLPIHYKSEKFEIESALKL